MSQRQEADYWGGILRYLSIFPQQAARLLPAEVLARPRLLHPQNNPGIHHGVS
jgi:hypothetical protein